MASKNILFIPVDDLRPQLGCYGHPQALTPHIDQLASEGTTFLRAYCQVPVCGASRASLLTGMRPHRKRFVDFKTRVDADVPDARTLPQYFRENGYTTVSVGKVFHHTFDTAPRSWSCDPWRPVHDPDETWRNYLVPENKAKDVSEKHRGPAFECADVDDSAYDDGKILDHAVKQLCELSKQDNPFFLAVGFLKPHLPFNAPKRYWELYDRNALKLADNPYGPDGAPEQALHNWGELRQYADIPAEGPLPEEMARNLVHGYNAATSYVDALVGRLVAELDALNLKNSTVIVLWGDHGWQLGEHGLWCKHCNFNTSLNAPLIVCTPEHKGGQRCNQLVEFVDIYPTLCELAGLPLPDHLEGKSFVPHLENPASSGKPSVFSRYMSGESVRTDRYLYTEWIDDNGQRTARMLYDHERDPDENINISENTDSPDLTEELSRLLLTHR